MIKMDLLDILSTDRSVKQASYAEDSHVKLAKKCFLMCWMVKLNRKLALSLREVQVVFKHALEI